MIVVLFSLLIFHDRTLNYGNNINNDLLIVDFVIVVVVVVVVAENTISISSHQPDIINFTHKTIKFECQNAIRRKSRIN